MAAAVVVVVVVLFSNLGALPPLFKMGLRILWAAGSDANL